MLLIARPNFRMTCQVFDTVAYDWKWICLTALIGLRVAKYLPLRPCAPCSCLVADGWRPWRLSDAPWCQSGFNARWITEGSRCMNKWLKSKKRTRSKSAWFSFEERSNYRVRTGANWAQQTAITFWKSLPWIWYNLMLPASCIAWNAQTDVCICI